MKVEVYQKFKQITYKYISNIICLIKLQTIIVFMYYKFPRPILEKSSSASIKLPQIQKPLKLNKNSFKSLKRHDYSLQTININEKQKDKKLILLRPSSINNKIARYSRQKSKSRAEPLRLKTENPKPLQRNSANLDQSRSKVDIDNTLRDFKSYIEQNREHIHQQINKRMHLRNSDKNIGAFKQKANNRKNKLLMNKSYHQQAQVFSSIQKIINKTNGNQSYVDLNQVEEKIKMADLKKNVRKLSPNKSFDEIKSDILNQIKSSSQNSKVILKDEKNYHQWRKVSLSATQLIPSYTESTLDIENERLGELALQTQASIYKYLETKKQLLELKSNYLKPTNV